MVWPFTESAVISELPLAVAADGRGARLKQVGGDRIAGEREREFGHRRLRSARVALTHRRRVQHLRRKQAGAEGRIQSNCHCGKPSSSSHRLGRTWTLHVDGKAS